MIEIDRDKIYESCGYSFKNFVRLSDDEILLVFQWRNSPEIRMWMYNRDVIKLDDHFRFISSLKQRDDRYYWLAYNEKGKPVGVFNINGIDNHYNSAETGSYAKPSNIMDSFNFSKACFYLFFEELGFTQLHSATDSKNDNLFLFANFWGINYNREEIRNENGKDTIYKVCDSYTAEMFREKASYTIRDFVQYLKER